MTTSTEPQQLSRAAFPPPRKPRSVREQIRDARAVLEAAAAADEIIPESEYPRVVVNKKLHILSELVHKKKPRWSWVKEHGTYLLEINSENNFTGKEIWICQYCGKDYAAKDSPTSLQKHLNRDHNRHDPKKSSTDPPADEPNAKRAKFISSLNNKKEEGPKKLIWMSDAENFRENLLDWIIKHNIPFAAIEHESFRKTLNVLDPQKVDELLPKSGDTISRWVQRRYEEQRVVLVRKLQASKHRKIHFSSDLWSSPNQLAMMAMIGHWVDEDWVLQTRLLSFPRVRGVHSGENMAIYFDSTIEEFGLQNRIGYFQADNAENNDTCAATIYSKWDPAAFAVSATSSTSSLRVQPR